ncbi:acyltransferase family protein [Aureliella helgolandensis]|uniref:O-acetyltransferase OatA n=1 Tax=Aureliella helgolandensis TaxID=2527968 RepID=A0A518G5L1_9BACT|nr:acyltransferase [Aureliella helgolandensis]QDV23868.1 O-acetyltransferase OatA [Aureliella helgolandensis]
MRNIGLDLLRIFAVLLVIGRHLHLPESSPDVIKACARGGWIGVDLFFVLSGFLVSSLLFREYQKHGSLDIKRFLIRRAFKIYPAFWLFLAFTLVMRWYLGQQPRTSQLVGEIFFFQNYLGGLWNHTWSLAVEEHFYIGLAFLVTCLIAIDPRRPFRRVPLIFAIIALSCFSFRLLNLVWFPEYSHRVYLFGTHIRIDSLMFGVLISYLWNYCELESRTAGIPTFLLVALAAALLSPAFIFQLETHKWISVAGVILFYLGSGVLLLAAIRWKTTESVLVQGIAGLGAASYSIYLWHMPVATWGHDWISQALGSDSYNLYLFTAVVGACVFGWLLNRMIENPVLLIRDRLLPSYSHAVKAGERSAANVGVERTSGNGESPPAAFVTVQQSEAGSRAED